MKFFACAVVCVAVLAISADAKKRNCFPDELQACFEEAVGQSVLKSKELDRLNDIICDVVVGSKSGSSSSSSSSSESDSKSSEASEEQEIQKSACGQSDVLRQAILVKAARDGRLRNRIPDVNQMLYDLEDCFCRNAPSSTQANAI